VKLSKVNPLHNRYLRFSILIFVVLAQAAIVAGEDTSNTSESPRRRCGSGSYCGIYCLYTVMKLSDVDVEPSELVKPQYIGSPKGSSLAELKKAAEDYGLYAEPVGKLTSRELRQSHYPIILHVKSAADRKEYDHYELFLETKNGQARLYDPPEPVRLVPFRELAPRWDGTGLIVSAEPIDLGVVFASARKRFITYAGIALVVVLTVRWVRRRWLPSTAIMSRRRLFGLSIVGSVGLALSAMLCGMVYHFVNEESFLAHPNATSSIQQAHLANFIPKLTERQIRKMLNNTDIVFIDARLADDFKAGHLEGAINVPVDANDVQRREALAEIDKDTRIVVYCQSAGCKFAEKVAIELISDGFSNVSIFKGDWDKWTAKNDK
jgi:rhodanese-related sulfurtransferase